MNSGSDKVYITPTEDLHFSAFLIPIKEVQPFPFEQAYSVLSQITSVDKVVNEIWDP